jgi:hypothetical protein
MVSRQISPLLLLQIDESGRCPARIDRVPLFYRERRVVESLNEVAPSHSSKRSNITDLGV